MNWATHFGLLQLKQVRFVRTYLSISSGSYIYFKRLKRNISYINTNSRSWNTNLNIVMLTQEIETKTKTNKQNTTTQQR